MSRPEPLRFGGSGAAGGPPPETNGSTVGDGGGILGVSSMAGSADCGPSVLALLVGWGVSDIRHTPLLIASVLAIYNTYAALLQGIQVCNMVTMNLNMIKAPNFALPDQDGVTRSVHDYAGAWLILYFYPEDDTPGCTTEACEFRDGHHDLAVIPAVVVGISADSVASHRRFADKYRLGFTLLSDESKSVIKAYGAWGPKNSRGLGFDGALRKTFLISPDGYIAKEYPRVTPMGHFREVAADIVKLKEDLH